MRAAIFAAALSAAHAARECGGECPAVVYNHLEGRGSSISSSGAPGFLALSSCCESLVKNGPTQKKTPGADGCGTFKDCSSCSLFSFCVWGKGACVEEVNLAAADHGAYSHSCSGPGPENFIGAIMKPEEIKIEPSVVPQGSKMTERPHMALAPVDWPVPFNGFLPPAGCSHKGMTEIEFQERFPSGLPGCGMYITGGMGKNNEGHTTTDIVSDPRLPSETNMAGYPLSANINLAAGDHLVGGGDWALPQPEAGWLEPNFNGNGCVGGPCDADDSATSLGIYGKNEAAL